MTKRGRSADFALEADSVDALWARCDDIEDQVLVGQMMFEGMRVGEAIHTRASWLRAGQIAIPDEQACKCTPCTRAGGLWRPKSAAGARMIPIAKPLVQPIHDYFRKCPGGLGFTRQAAWKRVKRRAEQASIPYLTPHALRATAATMFALAGFNAAELCLMMGWSDINRAWHYIQIAQARKGLQEKMQKLYR